MIGRAFCAVLTLACNSASLPSLPAYTQSGIPASEHPEIVRVDCEMGKGSAFRVSRDIILSVNHVTSLEGCFINGVRVNVIYHDGDFSIVKASPADRWLRVDCGGFVAGRKYVALGFARGKDTLTEVDLVATGEKDSGWSVLEGIFTVIPGQSGGPIIDAQTGAVVGTVNIYNAARGLSGSVPLAETSVCRS